VQLQARHIVRNVVFNWMGTLASLGVGFFLAPFILHRLGDVAYGVWVLAISVVSYLSLLDFGMQSSVLRFVSKGRTQGDHASASEALSAALWVRLQISAVILILCVVLSSAFAVVFKVPAALATDARIAIMLIGLTTALNMSVGSLGGVISGLNRYDLQTYVSLAQTAVRVTGVVYVLRSGHGIVAIAICELVAAIVSNTLLAVIARRLYPELEIRLGKPKRETLRRIWSYSVYIFLTTVAVQLVYQSDNLVVGAFVSAGAVTYYAIANSLCRYASQIVNSIGITFVPAASTYDAAGESGALLNLYKNGTRGMLLVSLPVLAVFVLRGGTFIRLWMGPAYARTSGEVLILLSVPLIFSFANRTVTSIAYGTERHKIMAYAALAEGVANLVLSIWLVHPFGIYGVALGTLIPSLVAQLGFAPWYATRLVSIRLWDIYMKIWIPVFLATIPFALACLFVEKYFPPQHLATFFLQVLITLPVFFGSVAIIFRAYVRSQILPRMQGWLPARG
jgi:O-antigen/teichoic acid export membrane protein